MFVAMRLLSSLLPHVLSVLDSGENPGHLLPEPGFARFICKRDCEMGIRIANWLMHRPRLSFFVNG